MWKFAESIKMKRKTRVTKEEIIAYREDKKISSHKRKKDLKPGPWTNLETEIEVPVTLRLNKSMVSTMSDYYGTYQDMENWYEKGWYPIIFSIQTEGLKELIAKHGLDKFLVACEKTLNELGLYGDVVLLRAYEPNTSNEDATKHFIACTAKTNKKHIKGFIAIRQGEYKVLE